MPDRLPKFYLTTPIYYVNARPHIGHAYTTIVADVLARRHRLLGDDTWFLTGTDEHGQKIERSAAAAGIAPQQFADQVSSEFRTLWDRMGLTYDQYIRTTEPAHQRGVQKLFSTLYERGQIYLSRYTGQYSVGEEMFVEGPPGTIGPDGKPTETVTEENFFFRLSDWQLPLLNFIESDTLRITPQARKNEVLSFLRGDVKSASRHANDEPLLPGAEQPYLPTGPIRLAQDPLLTAQAAAEVSHSAAGHAYVPGALKDLSISRSSFTWGVPVPEPAASLTQEPHIIYVWLDALANYMTAVGYGDDSPEGKAKFERYWPADLHVVGKEIIRFHCVYWPAFLLAAGLPLPKAIAAHGWLLFDDAKMSKSKGNIVRTETILEGFGTLCPPSPAVAEVEVTETASAAEFISPSQHERDLFAADVLRYFLLREIPFGQDGSFSFDALVTRYNGELVNNLGNTARRITVMTCDYFAAVVPELPLELHDVEGTFDVTAVNGVRFDLSASSARAAEAFQIALGAFDFSKAIDVVLNLLLLTNTYLTLEAPWKLPYPYTDATQKLARSRILYKALATLRIITALLYPILPYATASVWRQLGLGGIEAAARNGELNDLTWGGLKPGTKLGPLSPIFPRAEKGLAQTMIDMESRKTQQAAAQGQPKHDLNEPFSANDSADSATATASEFPEAAIASQSAASEAAASGAEPTSSADTSGQINIEDFAKVELRVAKVLVCERIPKADKLLRLEVDLGYEQRQILSGIAEWYTPEDLIGRRIVVITNLAPRKMRGLESHGMLLAASAPSGEGEKPGKPALATFLDSDDLPLGSRLK